MELQIEGQSWKYIPTADKAKAILDIGCALFDVSLEEVLGPRRARKIALPRMVMMAAMIKLRPDLTLVQIGWIFGNRDHTTVMHARDRLPEILGSDLRMLEAYMDLVKAFKQ